MEHSFLITGGSSFLGRACAKQIAMNNEYRVFITSRKDVSEEFNNILYRTNVRYLPNIDLTKEPDMTKLTEEIDKFFPGKFHVINCLGKFTSYSRIEETTIEMAKEIFESNILTLYAVAHKIIPLMKIRGGGHFIGFTSHTSYQNYPLMATYTASKAAVESLIKSISNECLADKIYANVIALATLQTPIEKAMKPNGDYENWLAPEQVYEIIRNVILYSSNLVNGTIIHAYKYSDSFFGKSFYERNQGMER